MKTRNTVALSTLAGIVALALTGAANAGPAAKPGYDFEKCYGVVKAGKNDCQTATGACAGTAAADSQGDAWVYVPKGTCERIVGASVTPKG